MLRTGLLSFLFFTIFIVGQVQGQGFNLGIRAGLAQSKFIGPVEAGVNESFGLTGGFHFGINFQWNFTDVLGWKTEIMYNQMGSKYDMSTDNGAYVFNDASHGISNLVFRDESVVKLNHSNAYVQFPQTINVKISPKFEIFGGGYFAFLLSPVATGTISFGGDNLDTEHSFIQGLNFNYASDPSFFNSSSPILIRVNGDDVDLQTPLDSKEFWNNQIPESRFRSIDYGLIGGGSFYINRGLYLMGRVEYGLRDVTRDIADYSFADVNDDGSLIYRQDNDYNLSLQLSIGFKF
ncbi:MAG: hypothetical protein ACI9FN_001465 [Saprospiraceae bacterium]|jgi:hypothetical protein